MARTVRERYEEIAALLVDTTDIANATGVTPQAVTNWAKRWDTYPAPLGTISGRPFYAIDEMDAFLKTRDYYPDWAARLP